MPRLCLTTQEERRRKIKSMLQAGKSTSEIRAALDVNRTAIFRVKKLLAETGDVKRRAGSGAKRTKRTKTLVKAVKAKIQRNPRRSMRQLSKEHSVSPRTMRRTILDLGMKSRAVTTRQYISESQKARRLQRSRKILSWLKSHPGVVTVFSDEKIFTVDQHVNRRNTRYISSDSPSDVASDVKFCKKSKHPAGVMVLGVVSSDGRKCPLMFVPQGQRIDSATYQELLQRQVIPWLEENFPGGNYVFQQDGAPAHTSASTQQFLVNQMTQFWDKMMWPPSSPDLNPLDFSIWARLETEACRTSRVSVDALRAAVTKSWGNLSPEYIRNVCCSFRNRLQQCIDAGGDYFE